MAIHINAIRMKQSSVAVPPNFSSSHFRTALGCFATGVTIVTARAQDGSLIGLTANSFNSVSLDPPLVLWSLSGMAASLEAFRAGSHYAIHVLAASQHDLAQRFSTRGSDRFAGLEVSLSANGVPLIAGCLAVFECFNRSRYEEGDHVIFVGEVERCACSMDLPPLLFHAGRFYTELSKSGGCS